MGHKNCEFCQRPADKHATICETCGQRFPLPKLKFGTKSECLRRALFWTAINFTFPPLAVWGYFFGIPESLGWRHLPLVLGSWILFVLITLLGRWFMDDGETIGEDAVRSPAIDGYEKYGGIGIEVLTGIVFGPLDNMTGAWADYRRHFD